MPRLLRPGEWHLPFVRIDNLYKMDDATRLEETIRVSVARCARVTHLSFETNKPSTVEEDLKLYDKLVGVQPLHASPAEHQATPDTLSFDVVDISEPTEEEKRLRMSPKIGVTGQWDHPEEHGNFTGWRQYRKMLPGEAVAPLPEAYR
jgi:hypothetical protein